MFSGLELTDAGQDDTIAAASGSLAGATSAAFAVTPAAPAQLVVAQPPPPTVTAGVPFGLAISVEDAFGNLVTTAANAIALKLSGGNPAATFGGKTTVNAAAGVAAFDDLTVNKGGSQDILVASSAGLVGVTTSDFAVTSARPARLVITLQPPASVTAGAGFGLGVSVEDAYGNLVSGYGGTVGVSLTGGPNGATLSGETTATASDGMASFSRLAIDRAGGDNALRVVVDGVGSITTSLFRVVPAAASQLAIVAPPPSQLVAGRTFGITIAAEDPFGNAVPGFADVVTVSLASGPAGGVLSGAASADAVGGIATLTGLAIDQAGAGYQLEATSGDLTSTTSTAMTVAPTAPSRLVITLQPPGRVVVKQPFAVGVEAMDVYGNVATDFDATVSAALAANRGHTRHGGALSVPASGGFADFSDLTLEKPGHSYAVTITGGGLTPAITSAFDATRPSAAGFAKADRKDSRVRIPAHRPGHWHRPISTPREPTTRRSSGVDTRP